MTTTYSHFNQSMVQQELVLTTKLHPLSSIHSLVSRPRLLARLDQGLEGRLMLLSAPAGSGKTTLLAEWLSSLHRYNVPSAWVSLDEGDNNSTRFWHYVYTALERIHPSIGEHLSQFFQAPSHSHELMLIHLVNFLTEVSTSFVLVLDDYHLITTEQIHSELTFLLEHMPTHMHLILLTRFEPSLPLARLRVRGQVLEIREADLRFTYDEVEQFFTKTMRLPFTPTHLESLTRRTEGWAAGLQLAALALQSHPDLDLFMTSFTGSSRYIVDYLLEEVISHQSEETQTFLLSTSVLDRMCASLCAYVLDNHQKGGEQEQQNLTRSLNPSRYCQEMLEYLERTNLFLIPLDHERQWYRYHHLFAEALLARLDLLHPSLVDKLRIRASTWYEHQGLLGESVEHTLTTKDSNTYQVPIATPASTVQLLPSVSQVKQQPLLDPLSERELEVLHAMAVGAPNATIARQLVIAPATVKRHLSNIFSKLGAVNRTQAVAQARNLGII